MKTNTVSTEKLLEDFYQFWETGNELLLAASTSKNFRIKTSALHL